MDMTNKEYFTTLNSVQGLSRAEWLFNNYSRRYTDSVQAILAWLDEEYTPVKPVFTNNPESDMRFCPVCYTPVVYGDKKCCKCITDIDWSK